MNLYWDDLVYRELFVLIGNKGRIYLLMLIINDEVRKYILKNCLLNVLEKCIIWNVKYSNCKFCFKVLLVG